MQQSLLKKKDWYLKKYGIYPEFKGSLHSGEVTTGEIGALKKEIFFTGDVLNTTSRIQSLCNLYQKELLTSKSFKENVPKNNDFQFTLIDTVNVKGKSKSIKIYSISQL